MIPSNRWSSGKWIPVSLTAQVMLRCVCFTLVCGMTLACNDLAGLAGKQPLPSGIPDPSTYHTATGALTLYQTALVAAEGESGQSNEGAFVDAVLHTGLLSDELQAGDLGCSGVTCMVTQTDSEDARQLPVEQQGAVGGLYEQLQAVRGTANEAIGALAAYDDSAPPALMGHLYALQGYAELFLADLYCSGVPLSTLDFNGDYTYHAGSSTGQLYQDAIAKFDTAIALAKDSARIQFLAFVGKGRALLALGSLPEAAAAVTSVPDHFTYQYLVNWQGTGQYKSVIQGNGPFLATVADRKGGNGVPYFSIPDPRTASQIASTNDYGQPQYVPLKYGGATPGIAPLTVADWIEARLIRAEASLATGDVPGWLAQLNDLRQTAITPALAVLTDPGLGLSSTAADTARVSLLFQERAKWLFLTGHRQGDLRRLIREYHRFSPQVYPSGAYPKGFGFYSPVILTAPVPSEESVNPHFTGCFSRGA